MNIGIKKIIELSEFKRIAELANVIWHETYDPILPAGQTAYMLEKYQSVDAIVRQTSVEGYVYFGIFCDDEMVGFLGIVPHYDTRERMYLSKVYLAKEFRGRGVMRVAFAFVDSFCKECGCNSIWLTVNKHNTHAKDVYEHFGYQNIESIVTDIGGGYVMDDYVMEKCVPCIGKYV